MMIRIDVASDFAHAASTRGHCARATDAGDQIEIAQCPPYGLTPDP
jgi:hypothetical protein